MTTYYAIPFKPLYSKGKPQQVIITERTWDGIDRPDYKTIATMSPDDARFLGQQLFDAAEAIDGKSKKDRTSAKIKANIVRAAKKEAMG